jgi:hypothetical protein
MRGSSWLLICGLALVTAACNGDSGAGQPGSASGSANTLDKGFCADTCPKPCGQDNDCMTSSGELCCDFGSDGKACVAARDCPRKCQSDTKCDTVQGEACVRVTLESSDKFCADATLGLQLCKKDGDCSGKGEVCCGAYKEPVCVAASSCPKSCAASRDCNTGSGEICCDTLPKLDKTLKTGGLCVAPSDLSCPKACKQSSDCNTKQGELCCDGFCSDSCEHACKVSSDCSGQICCKTRAALSPLANGIRRPGYLVTGNSSGSCRPGSQSVPRSAADPCPQTMTACSQAGMVAVSVCQSDGSWSPQCQCLPPGAIMGSAGAGAGGRAGGGAGSGVGGFAGGAGSGSSCPGFSCRDGQCIDPSWRCDGVSDCQAGEDELGCGTTTGPSACAASSTTTCQACCDRTNRVGSQQFLDATVACVCDPGPCASACSASSFCANPDLSAKLSSACSACVSSSCASSLSQSCMASSSCVNYLNCLQGC